MKKGKQTAVPATRYRNPLATAAIMKKGGRHEKSHKAHRLKNKAAIKNTLKTMSDKHSHGFFYAFFR